LHHSRLFHVPGLLLQLISLSFVHFPPLENLERFLFNGCLAWAVAHFGEFSLISGQLGVYGGELYVD
jgi:hypothetical protein